jgi:flagellar assembly protein FliH
MYLWKPPSFDAPLPPLPGELEPQAPPSSAVEVSPAPIRPVQSPSQDLQALKAKAHQEGFLRGMQEGLAEGRMQGEAMGREEGWKVGLEEGRAEGFAQGLQDTQERVTLLTQSMASALAVLSDLPRQLEPALTDWVYETGRRLAGQQSMSREIFVGAVQEALMRLPRPGETLFLRVASADLALWHQVVDQLPSGMAVSLLDDAHLACGHAYLELAGTCVDIGSAARDALVRSALGMLAMSSESTEG